MIIKSLFIEDSTATLRARITSLPTAPDTEGTPLVQADFASISLYAYSDGTVVGGFNPLSLTIANVVYDTLQGWEVDDVGYNFKYSVGPTAFPTGNVFGQILVKFTLTTGEVDHIEFKGKVQNLLSS